MSFELGKPSPLQKQTVLCINTLSMLNVSLRLDFGGSWGRYSASSSGFEGHTVCWCCLMLFVWWLCSGTFGHVRQFKTSNVSWFVITLAN